jgi:hypothetical protein
VEFRHHYSIRGWKARLFHWIAGRRIAKESQATTDNKANDEHGGCTFRKAYSFPGRGSPRIPASSGMRRRAAARRVIASEIA